MNSKRTSIIFLAGVIAGLYSRVGTPIDPMVISALKTLGLPAAMLKRLDRQGKN